MKDFSTPNIPRGTMLRDLPLAARLTLALFLISVGIGYVSALVQLHFQHASPGAVLPTPEDAVRVFHGPTGEQKSKIEQLLPADYQGLKMTGQGQMTEAFYRPVKRYEKAISKRAEELAKRRGGKAEDPAIKGAAKAEVDRERDGERLAMLAWIHAGAPEEDYDADQFPLPKELADRPLTRKYLVEDDAKSIKIKTLFEERCATCHIEGGQASKYPLLKLSDIRKYTSAQTSSAMSLEKLAQTTHVHLLGFSLLYGLTGLILAFSSYPRLARILLCPLPLLAQVADISFWWLARLPEPHGPQFARAIAYSGAVVAVGLLAHIVLALFDLFSKKAWLVLLLLFALAGYGGYVAKERVVDPYLAGEKAPAK